MATTGCRYDSARRNRSVPHAEAHHGKFFNLQSTPPHLANTRRAWRSRLLILLVGLCAAVLTACGANVNSQLTLQADHSGERVFVLTMASADVNRLSGGVEAADRAFEAHTPEVLNYNGIQAEDEGYSATFTMPFDDPDDYQRKITALLNASRIPESQREMTVEIEDQALTTSIVIQESFYNDDLMAWAADALVTEGIVSESTTVFTSNGTATVVVNGQEIETSTSLPRINFSHTEDHRFEEVGLDFEINESGEIGITMSYFVSPESREAQDAFLTEQVTQLEQIEDIEIADSGPVAPESQEDKIREITATFPSDQAVAEGIQLLLANDEATFEVVEEKAPDSPDTTIRYIGSNWTCDAICDPHNLQQLSGETHYPEHWEVAEQQRDDGDLLLEFNRGMPLNSLTSSTHLGFTGDMSQTFEFVVDNEAQEGHENLVAERFAPPEGTGSFSTSSRDATTVYSVNFEAEDATELSALLNQYFAAKDINQEVTVRHAPITGFWPSYDLHVDLSPIWELTTGEVEGPATFRVELPAMHSGDTESSAEAGRTVIPEDSSGRFTITASGPTLTTVWSAAILVLLAAVGVVLLLRTRKASTKLWAAATADDADTRPYNIQGPRDKLTETEILSSPAAPGPHAAKTTEFPDRPASQETTRYHQTGPFPDVPVPSQAEYEQLELDESEEASKHPPAAPDDPSNADTERPDGRPEKEDS